MRKVTTTSKIKVAINNEMLKVTKAEIYYKTLGTTEVVNTDLFCESLDFLCKSGIFADALGWHYRIGDKTNSYIAETGRMNPDSEIIITVYLDVCEGACKENVEKVLSVTEEE